MLKDENYPFLSPTGVILKRVIKNGKRGEERGKNDECGVMSDEFNQSACSFARGLLKKVHGSSWEVR
jgi:hypothetical protein